MWQRTRAQGYLLFHSCRNMGLIRRRNWRLLLAFVFLSLKRSSWTYREPMKMSLSTNYIPCKDCAACCCCWWGGQLWSSVWEPCQKSVLVWKEALNIHWRTHQEGGMLVLLELEGKWKGILRRLSGSMVLQKLKPIVTGWWCLRPCLCDEATSATLCVSIRIPQNLLLLCPMLSLFVLFPVWGYLILLNVQKCCCVMTIHWQPMSNTGLIFV